MSFILVLDNFGGYPDKFGSNCRIRAYITEKIIDDDFFFEEKSSLMICMHRPFKKTLI